MTLAKPVFQHVVYIFVAHSVKASNWRVHRRHESSYAVLVKNEHLLKLLYNSREEHCITWEKFHQLNFVPCFASIKKRSVRERGENHNNTLHDWFWLSNKGFFCTDQNLEREMHEKNVIFFAKMHSKGKEKFFLLMDLVIMIIIACFFMGRLANRVMRRPFRLSLEPLWVRLLKAAK